MPYMMKWLRNMELTMVAIILLFLVNGDVRGQSSASVLRPVSLRCEYLVNPLGVDAAQPRLRWVLESQRGERGRSQTAY